MKSVLIIGMGHMGRHLASKLQELGNEVMIVDKDPDVIAALSDRFTDCADDAWYTSAILWASQNKVVNGYGKVFKPNQAVTRQELATILYKYAVLNGADQVTSYAVSYTDTISDWAMAGVAYCTASKLMTGVGGGRFGAASSATRAQGAQILMTIDKLEKAA